MVRVKPARDAGQRSSWHFRRGLFVFILLCLLAVGVRAQETTSDDPRLIGYTSDAIYSACEFKNLFSLHLRC
jgi:hypothetical protein